MITYNTDTDLLNDTARKLGFRINDKVKLHKRFFSNHQLKYIDIGIGTVQGKHLPDGQSTPSIIVQFPTCTDMFSCKQLFELLLIRVNSDKSKNVLMAIYPAYLEKVDDGKRKSKKSR